MFKLSICLTDNKQLYYLFERRDNMQKYYTAKSDLIFQQALCLEEDKDILTWFIGQFFDEEIKDLKIETPVLPIGNKIEKQKTVDLLVSFVNKKVNLEVNSCHYRYLNDRNFSYIADVYSSQFKRGDGLKGRPEVIQLNFTWGLPKDYKDIPIFIYQVYDKEHDLNYINNLKIIVYNMDYFRREYYNEEEGKFKKGTPKHLLMLDASSEELTKLSKGDKIMTKFKENVDRLNSDPNVISFLTEEEEREVIQNSYYDDGLEDGQKIGEKIGEERGQKIGQKMGKLEEKTDIAKKMLQNGIDIGLISKITDLSKKEIESLK